MTKSAFFMPKSATNSREKESERVKQIKSYSERVPIKEAAHLLGMSPHGVRILMQKKAANIGFIVENAEKKTYVILRERLNRVIGKETK